VILSFSWVLRFLILKKKGIFISQRKYTLEIIKDGGYLRVKHVDFSREQNTKFSDEGELLKDLSIY